MKQFRYALIGTIALAALAGCSDSGDETNAARAERQEGQPASTPAPSGVTDTAPTVDRDPTPESGSGGDQQTSQPEQPKPSP